MTSSFLWAFGAGSQGPWRIERIVAAVGEPLPPADRLVITAGGGGERIDAWTLHGTTSNTRYTRRMEVDELTARQAGMGRPEAKLAALIPIRKTPEWWALAQDERRAVFEEQSRHIGIGMEYLPGVARRLHHSRELGEPFDFLTWFEYAPEHAAAFEHMVDRLRETPEWRYVDREVDIRLRRD